MSYYQQGDVLLKSVTELPKKTKKLKGGLVHKGDNHHHVLKGKFQLHSIGEEIFIEVKAKSKLEHEEHKTLTIPKGIYQKGIVQEYDHWLEESRNVID